MGSRAFGGYTYRDRIEIGSYGELSRAINGAGGELRILHVDRELARLPGFVEALARHAGALGGLEHRNIVSTLTLGRTPEGVLVVATAAVDRAVAVDRLLEAGPPPAAIALALAMAVAEALAAAHARGIVHGRVHPRSLLVDGAGIPRLDHFAVARALALAAAQGGDVDPDEQFRGYLAPELLAGGPPDPATDVFGAGALMYALYGGEPDGGAQAGRIRATTAIRRAVSRAMDPDPAQRFRDGAELREALAQAAVADGSQRAASAALAAWVGDVRHRVGDDSEVSDVSGVDELIAGLAEPSGSVELDGVLAELAGEAPANRSVAPRGDRGTDELDTTVQDEPSDVGDTSQLTHVDEPPDHDRDPISELISLGGAPAPVHERPSARLRLDSGDDDEHTPLPPPTPDKEGSFTREGQEVLAGTGRSRLLERAAADAIAELEDEQERDRPRPAAPRLPSQPTEHVPLRRGLPGWVWLLLTLAALGGMFWLVWTRTDVFHPERARARQRQKEAETRAKEVRLRSEQLRGADITITANDPRASVWLYLGRTPTDGPLETMPLPSYQPHYLRIERTDYRPVDVAVLSRHWSGESAFISVPLEATAKAETLPAFPPRPPASDSEGFAGNGRGVLHIETRPGLADVWLLVGYTSKPVELHDFPAGPRYEFRALKDGVPAARQSIEPDAWPDHSSDEPGAMKRAMQVDLEFGKPK